jgi:hypothetical protein
MPDMTAGRPGRWILAAVTLMIAAGCSVGSGPPSTGSVAATGGGPAPSASPSPVSPSPSPSPSPASSSTAPPTAFATPLPDLTSAGPVPLARVLLICELWGENPPDSVIGCRDGASLALAALGPDRAARAERLGVAYGSSCPAAGACADRRPDVLDVTARLGVRPKALRVRIVRGPTGELLAWPATPVAPPPEPAFDPPPVAAPALDGAPPAVRDREPLPFCGDEDATGDVFDAAARRCFLDGIRAGSPVELLSRSASTEGDAVETVYRWPGTGSVVKSVRNAAGWQSAVCAITPIETAAVFVLAGGCDPVDP